MEISRNFKAAAIDLARECIGADLGDITDGLYTEFSRNGNRVNYEEVNFRRRIILNRLALGALCSGGFTGEIERVVSAILNEKTWVLPAHSGGILPMGGERIIDLFSAQTAAQLSIIAANIKIRYELYDGILKAVNERIFEPFLKYDYWWTNTGKNRRKNPSNWTPWCIHSILECARAFNAEDTVFDKCKSAIENYFCDYPQDGGCDEGAQYWAHSVGHFFECDLPVSDIKKADNMYSFIMRANLAGDWYMNFADCAASFHPDAAMIFLMGRQAKNERLMTFARSVLNSCDPTMRDNMDLRAKINAAKVSAELEGYSAEFKSEKSDIIPSLGVGVFRNDSFAVSVKGGNNGENHNHNDCGNFIVMRGKLPVIIDAGVGEYTRDTFSENRYRIWTMQSSYHNLPDINGYLQCDGEEFAAKSVEFYDNGFSCDIAGAYPKDAGVLKAVRSIRVNDNEVIVSDSFGFLNERNSVRVNLMLWDKPAISCGEIATNGSTISLDGAKWHTEEICFGDDEKLSPVWGDTLYRVFCEFECGSEIKTILTIRRMKS